MSIVDDNAWVPPDNAWDDILMDKLVFFIRQNWSMQDVINHLDGKFSAMEIMTRWSAAYAISQINRKSIDKVLKKISRERINYGGQNGQQTKI